MHAWYVIKFGKCSVVDLNCMTRFGNKFLVSITDRIYGHRCGRCIVYICFHTTVLGLDGCRKIGIHYRKVPVGYSEHTP